MILCAVVIVRARKSIFWQNYALSDGVQEPVFSGHSSHVCQPWVRVQLHFASHGSRASSVYGSLFGYFHDATQGNSFHLPKMALLIISFYDSKSSFRLPLPACIMLVS